MPNLDRQDGKEAVTLLEIYETPHVVVENPTSKMPMTAVDTASNVKLQLAARGLDQYSIQNSSV